MSSKKNDIKIKFCETPDDIRRCNDFYNEFYREKRSIKKWKWLFKSEIISKSLFVFAELDGKIVGTQAIIPMFFLGKKGKYLTAKTEETLLSPSVRGLGIFEKMYECIFDRIRDEEIKFIWGFSPAIKPFKKVGFEVPAFTKQLIFPLNSLAIENFLLNKKSKIVLIIMRIASFLLSLYSFTKLFLIKKKNSKYFKDYKLNYIDKLCTDFDKISTKFHESWNGETILRDKSFLEWRFFNNPFIQANIIGVYKSNNLVGWLSYSIDENSVAYIVDVHLLSYKNNEENIILDLLLLRLISDVKKAGVSGIRNWNISGHKFDNFIKIRCLRNGFYFINKGKPIVWKNLSNDKDYDWDNKNIYINRVFSLGPLG